jgi:predicted nuclease of restriction endonuclease-like (RecB) superfamily
MEILSDIQSILRQARQKAYQSVNLAMVQSYWLVGKRIVEDIQNGENRAEYGKSLLINLSNQLSTEFGKGFSVDNLTNMRSFYLQFPISETVSRISNNSRKIISETVSPKLEKKISQTLSAILETPDFQLSWSHYLMLISINDLNERKFYEVESIANNWSLRELKRQYNSGLFMRLSMSKDKKGILDLAQKGQLLQKPIDAIKEPYVLEFLQFKEHYRYSENDLENELIDKLEYFLLELGKGFTFVARQNRITFDEKHFYIDLVFYNRLLKCFVIIDLKIGELQHEDIGQMQMYVNYYDRNVKLEDENKTIGIILCQKKSDVLVEMTLPQENEQIFASRYQTILPSKEQLRELLKSKED